MAAGLDPYLCERHLAWLAAPGGSRVSEDEGTLLFFDVSGFTPLTERLARRGRAGVEELIETLNGVIAPLVSAAGALGGDTLKFGGDALLLMFTGDGHEARACAAAWELQDRMGAFRRLRTSAGVVTLRASAGVASGRVHTFLVGDRFAELVIAGPVTSDVMRLESVADAGEVLVGASTQAALDPAVLGAPKDPGRLLAARPAVAAADVVVPARGDAARGLPVALHHHLGPEAESEHRRVVVAFAQFRGLDELLAERGAAAAAEELHDFMSRVQAACDRHGVTFLATDADKGAGKVFLVTGAPTASTDDEDRMLQALREIVEHRGALRVRAGVTCGRAFAVHLGAPERRTYTTMGDTTNLAARVMGKAPDGGVLATRPVLERVRAPFELEAVAPFTVKGKSAPVDAVLVGPLCVPAASEQDDGPLVGREAEVGALREALARGRLGEGGVVEVVGDPGMGKSRLVAALRAHAAADGARTILVEGGAYARTTPWFALRAPLRALVAPPGADDASVAGALDQHVERHMPAERGLLPLLAIPFGIDLPPTPETASLAAEFSRERLYLLLDRLLGALLPVRSTLLVVEDAQYLDVASAGFLRALLRRAPGRGLTVVVTRRPEPGGLDLPGPVARISLEPLAEDAARELVALEGRRQLVPHVVDGLVARGAGNPLFLRELVAASRAGADLDDLPTTVEALLTARLDTLPPGQRRTLRRAAVLGLRFPVSWLRGILELSDEELAPCLAELDEFLVVEPGRVRFRQALARQAAYEALTFRGRQELHARAGHLIEAELGADAERRAGILSLHFCLAGDHERTWHYGRIAGDRARARFAHADAALLYGRALDAARALRRRDVEVAGVWEARAEAHAAAGEPAAAARALDAARALVRGDPLREARLAHRQARLAAEAGRVTPAVRWLKRGMRLLDGAEGRAAGVQRAGLVAALAMARQRAGRMEEAIGLCHEAIDLAEAVGADEALAHACFILDWALVESGRADTARYSARALEIYRRLGDLDRESAVLNNLGGFAYREGRWDDAVALYREGAAASARAGALSDAAVGDVNIGEVRSDQGRWEEAEEHLRHAADLWTATGDDYRLACATAFRGRLSARVGRPEEADRLLHDALARFRDMRTSQDVVWVETLVPEARLLAGRAERALQEADRLLLAVGTGRFGPQLRRVRGCALAQLGRTAEAATVLEDALADAREQRDHFEVALVLDALLALPGAGDRPGATARRRERDRIGRRLGLVRLPPAAVSAPDRRDVARA